MNKPKSKSTLAAEYDLRVAELRHENSPTKRNSIRLARVKRRLAESK